MSLSHPPFFKLCFRQEQCRPETDARIGSGVFDEPDFLETINPTHRIGKHTATTKFTRHVVHSEETINIGCPEFSENLTLGSNPVEPDITVFQIPLVDHPDRL